MPNSRSPKQTAGPSALWLRPNAPFPRPSAWARQTAGPSARKLLSDTQPQTRSSCIDRCRMASVPTRSGEIHRRPFGAAVALWHLLPQKVRAWTRLKVSFSFPLPRCTASPLNPPHHCENRNLRLAVPNDSTCEIRSSEVGALSTAPPPAKKLQLSAVCFLFFIGVGW
jgi:hypothetical protein